MHQQHICDKYQHQWVQKQKKTEDAEAPKNDKNNGAKTLENIVLHLKLVRGIRGTLPAYVIWCHIKVAHILPGYGTYLNLDNEVIARAPIIDSRSNLKMTQETLDMIHSRLMMPWYIRSSLRCSQTWKLMSMWNREKGHKTVKQCSLVARQATEAERKLQNSHYDGKRNYWDWDKYVTHHNEQHVIMEHLTDYGYSDMDNDTKVHHFL